MIDQKIKEFIDNATFEELFVKRRFEPIGSKYFQDEANEYFMNKYSELRKSITDKEYTEISKRIGWN